MFAAAKQQVLLVDDEPQMLVALEDLLSDQFSVLKADSGERALALLERERDVAAIVTDQRMPRMNGDELLAKLTPTHDASRILLTGYADLGAVTRAVNEGRIFAYITKPWNGDDLRAKVRQGVDRFRLSRELASERKLLHNLMENIPDAIYFKNREGRFIRANIGAALQAGLTDPIDLVGCRLEDLPMAAQTEAEQADERFVMDSGHAIVDRVRGIVRDGKTHWFSRTCAPIRDRSGQIVGLVGISRDVTERIQTDEALRVSEAQLKRQTALLNSILNSMGEGVVVADRAGDFLMFNPQAARILGKSVAGVSAASWADHFGLFLSDRATRLPEHVDPLACAISGDQISEQELYVRDKGREDAVVAVTGAPLKDEHGQIAGGVVVLRDVTEQRMLQQQLSQSQKMEAIGRLAGGIAHDFNNLLVVIDSYSELVARTFSGDDQRREDLQQVMAASKRAAALTKQLLAFSRRQMIQPTIVSLNDVVSSVEKMLKRVIGENIELCTQLEPNLRPVRADVGQLEQIILNLTVNARDAMPEGGKIRLRTANLNGAAASMLDVSGDLSEEFVMFEVSDTGTGMSAEIQKRIFEPFFTTKAPEKGTGLGLATVYGIVKQSRGHISVRSEVNVGTTFSIVFPASAAPLASEADKERDQRFGTGTGTILLLEDDDAVRRVALRVLSDAGYRVLEASRAPEARAILAREGSAIDLLLIDVVMPQISGPRFVAEVSPSHPRMRVLYMSGYSEEAVHMSADPALQSHFMQKPFTPDNLLSKVHGVLQLAQGRHAG